MMSNCSATVLASRFIGWRLPRGHAPRVASLDRRRIAVNPAAAGECDLMGEGARMGGEGSFWLVLVLVPRPWSFEWQAEDEGGRTKDKRF